MKATFILHGGAGNWENHLYNHDDVQKGMFEAAERAWLLLKQGASALDVVEAATVILENNPLFDAGVGSFLNNVGEAEMDALITDGSNMMFGAVAALKHIKNPIKLARMVMTHTPHAFFVADGAERLAVSLGMQLVSNLSFVTPQEFVDYQRRLKENAQAGLGMGTVGAVAVDNAGNFASATSTGGTPHKLKGRVGDVPIFGAGGYSDNRYGGASATGHGEKIMRTLMSRGVIDELRDGKTAQHAAETVIHGITDVGVITLDAEGRVGAAHSTPFMPTAWVDEDGNIQVSMGNPYPFI
jgi:beta-aspartyl-peptidase (threonine type)